MSYQFEDDSALEELLNQQLDRRKQQSVPRFQQQQQQQPSRPSTAAPATTVAPSKLDAPPPLPSSVRPSTSSRLASNKPSSATASEVGGDRATTTPKSKLSSWLEASKSNQAPPAEAPSSSTTTGPEPRRQSLLLADRSIHSQQQTSREASHVEAAAAAAAINEAQSQLIELANEEDQLQEMSKQRLIQLIVGQIGPLLRQLAHSASDNSGQTVEELRRQLELERNRRQLVEATHLERIQLEEQKWKQIIAGLEARLESGQLELSASVASQREHLARLEREHREYLARIIDNYERKLSEEQRYFGELLEKRDQLHQLEMDSKFKINCNLNKLDTMQEQWTRSIAATIQQLEGQYKSIEALLDQQALKVNATNSSLVEKSASLASQLRTQTETTSRLDQLATELGAILPNFVSLRAEGDRILVKTSEKLEELHAREAELRAKEQQVEEMRCVALREREEQANERLKLALESERLLMREARLGELVAKNELCEASLRDQRSQQAELEAKLQATRLSLDSKAGELREQNFDLHLLRRKLNGQREELISGQTRLARREQSLEDRLGKFRDDTRKLAAFRNQVRRELNQLNRLQKSLVCSLCLSRLFGSSASLSLGGGAPPPPQIDQI